MTTAEQTERDAGSREAALREWARDNATTTVGLVAAVTVLGLVLRLVLLGDRVAHWDEGRVAYWILYYQDSGSFAYRHIIHGPFVQHANRWLFALVGSNDFTMRLPVALVGTALPLTALLFREHLRKAEVVAMALFLALNPVLLYYSRFMRSDILVAVFMFAAFGFLVRFYDTRRFRYLYAAAALIACGFASKENAIVYVLTWLGAAALLAEHALFRPREYDSGYDLVASKVGTVRHHLSTARGYVIDRVIDYGFHIVFATGLFLLLSLFFYAPRGAGLEGLQYPPAQASAGAVGFWEAVFNPTRFPAMVDGTVSYVVEEFGNWGGKGPFGGEEEFTRRYGDQAGTGNDNAVLFVTTDFVSYLGQYVEVMITKAAPLTAFAIFGFVLERFGTVRSRSLVLFTAYGGFVSVIGYPLGTDVFGAWIVVHALVPLTIPAAVGLTRVYDWGYEAFAADDTTGVAIAALLLLLVAGQVAWVGTTSVYVDDQSEENSLVQYAQPGGEVRPALANISRAGADSSEVLLYYGEQGDRYDSGDAIVERDRSGWNTSRLYWRPLCAKWFNSLPLPWYLEDSGADVNCERTASGLESRVGADGPPVIITVAGDTTVPEATLEQHYEARTYEMRTYGTETTYWVNEDWYERQTE